MKNSEIQKSILKVARFYDGKKVGDVGPLGFRRSTDLGRLLKGFDYLISQGLLVIGKSLFLDMGCADGRVNVLLSYLVKRSIGIERDEWSLDEYIPLRRELEAALREDSLPLPPNNISLFHGNSMDECLHETINRKIGVRFDDFDLFYTYLTMQDEFAELIIRKAKKGAVFMVYGLDRVMPHYKGLKRLTHRISLQGILALYQK